MGAGLMRMVVALTSGRPAAAEHETELTEIAVAAAMLQSRAPQPRRARRGRLRRRHPRAAAATRDRPASARRARCRSRPRPARRRARRCRPRGSPSRFWPCGERLAPIGSRNAISDVGVGALLAACRAARRGAERPDQPAIARRGRRPAHRGHRPRWRACSTASTSGSGRSASRSRGPRMTARLLDGRALATHLRAELRQRVERLAATVGHGSPPVLAILSDGHHGAASLYAASLERAAKSVGVETEAIVDGDALVPAIERAERGPARRRHRRRPAVRGRRPPGDGWSSTSTRRRTSTAPRRRAPGAWRAASRPSFRRPRWR